MTPIELNKPIRFLCIRWDEHWEFDCPTVLLEPIERYSSNGIYVETMIEDVCIDIALSLEKDGAPLRPLLNEGDAKEFKWRGWNIKRLRKYAELMLECREDEVPKRYRHMEFKETYITFYPSRVRWKEG